MDGRVFTEAELGLLVASRHGRLVSLGADDTPQIHAVSFVVDAVSGCIDISGPRLRDSQKYRNIRHDPRVTLIVDDDSAEAHDLATAKGRKLEIRGIAELSERPAPGMSTDVIRIRPVRIDAWNLAGDGHDSRFVT